MIFVPPLPIFKFLAHDRVRKFMKQNPKSGSSYADKYLGFLVEEIVMWWLKRMRILFKWVDLTTHDLEILAALIRAEIKGMRQGGRGPPPDADEFNIPDRTFGHQAVQIYLLGRVAMPKAGDIESITGVYLVGGCTRAHFLANCKHYEEGEVVTKDFTAKYPCRAIQVCHLTPFERIGELIGLPAELIQQRLLRV